MLTDGPQQVSLTRAQIAGLYGLARRFDSIVVVQDSGQPVLVEHPSSGRQWLLAADGAALKLS